MAPTGFPAKEHYVGNATCDLSSTGHLEYWSP